MNWGRNKISIIDRFAPAGSRRLGNDGTVIPDLIRNPLVRSSNVIHRLFMFLIFIISTVVVQAATIVDGNSFLKNGQIDEAIVTYESVVKDGYMGHELFFNLATAYSKKGNTSKAILNFEKALRLKPLDGFTKQQIIAINLKLQDKPPIYEDTGVLSILKKIQYSLSIDAWAFLSIFFMLLMPIVIFISYKFQQIKIRKMLFLSSILWFLLSGFSVIMARNNYHFKYLHTEGVVYTESIKVYDQPDPQSTISFNLHEGTKVEIDDSTETMYHIQFAEKKGWIVNKDVQKIEL